MVDMLPISAVEGALEGRGFEQIKTISGTSYKDSSTVIICPTRGTINHKVVAAWQNLMAPMNQKRAFLFCVGSEVGQAYNQMIQQILADPQLSTWKYVLTLEDDNLPPPDAHLKLIESIESNGGIDCVAGIYFTKGDFSMPQAYGDPNEFRRTGVLDFRPLDIRDALQRGQLIEVNGVAMGCTLYRMSMFREVPAPWFVTVQEYDEQKGAQAFTQDLAFCHKARQLGKRFAVDCRVRVGHLDINSGVVY